MTMPECPFDLPARHSYGLTMPNKYRIVTAILQDVSAFAGWHVVQPTPRDLSGGMWIQNTGKSLDAYVPLSADY